MTKNEQIIREIAKNFSPKFILNSSFLPEDGLLLDLSVNNKNLLNINVSNQNDFTSFIFRQIYNAKKKFGFGGYLENRKFYNRSEVFTANKQSRNIHLGVDIWIEPNTPIYCPLPGKIHSFKNNNQFGDYGPTIITQHQFFNHTFYLLFGHLSVNSLQNIDVNMPINTTKPLASIGNYNENVGWPPHLHFQIIFDLQNNYGDYPGVCLETDKPFFAENCPNPNLLLQLPV